MNKIYKNLIKSFLLGVAIIFIFYYIFMNIIKLNGRDAGMATTAIAITSTMIFCTYTIVDTIKEYCKK